MSAPNPGSREARDAGCICPVLDNAHGRGYMGGMRDDDGNVVFVRVVDCRLHSQAGREVSERVVNVKVVGRSACDVFIGRPSKWGNPFKIGLDGTREEVVAKYREWITKHPTLDPRELRGQVLGCFCAPLACHGHVLAELADSGERIEGTPSS